MIPCTRGVRDGLKPHTEARSLRVQLARQHRENLVTVITQFSSSCIWNPQKVLYPSDIPGIFQVYDHLCHMNGIYLVYTRYIPGIRQSRYIPGIYQVYSSHILFQEKGIYPGYTRNILSESTPGLNLVYTRFIPAQLKSCDPSCSISAIAMQRHTGFGLQGCLMFITALARADSRRRRRRRRRLHRRRRRSSNGDHDGRRRSSSWLWRRSRHRRPSRRRRWRRLLCRCRLCRRRRRGSRRRRRSHGATCTLAGGSEGGRTGPRRRWGEFEDETLPRRAAPRAG